MKYRKRPVEVEAFRWMIDQVPEWWKNFHRAQVEVQTGKVMIDTGHGAAIANPGDWIIRGVEGEIYPCTPSVFAKTYEPVH